MRNLGEGLVRRGIDVTAIVSRREDRTQPYVDAGVKVEPIVESWGLKAAVRGEASRIRELIKSKQVDVVHTIYPDPYLRYGSDSYHLPFLLKWSKAPLVVTFFGFGVTGASPITKAGLLSLFATADEIVITDSDLLHLFRKRFPFWRRKASGGLVGSIATTTSARWSQQDLEARQQQIGLPGGIRYVGFFGFWGPGKGLEELVEAIATLRNLGTPVQLVLIGGREPEHRTDYERGIIDQIQSAGISDAVIQTGFVEAESVATYLSAMDLCVLPIKVNPLGRSSLAMAVTVGVPTVVTRPATGAELLTGVSLLDVPDAVHIAAAIQAILRDRTIQQEGSDAARAASSHWSWESIVDQYATIYRRLKGHLDRVS